MDGAPVGRERDVFPGVLGALGLVASVLFAQVAVAIALRRSVITDPAAAIQVLVLAIVLGNGLVLAVFLGRRHLRYREVLHPSPASVAATLGLLAVPILLLSPGLFVIASALDDVVDWLSPMSESQRQMFAQLVRGGFASALALVFAAPFFEELVFRGIILRGLLARMSPRGAIVTSALIFGAAHLNLPQFVTGVCIGLPLGWLYWRFRSTLPGIVLHAAHNGLTLWAATAGEADTPAGDIPVAAIAVALILFAVGVRVLLAIAGRLRQSGDDASS